MHRCYVEADTVLFIYYGWKSNKDIDMKTNMLGTHYFIVLNST